MRACLVVLGASVAVSFALGCGLDSQGTAPADGGSGPGGASASGTGSATSTGTGGSPTCSGDGDCPAPTACATQACVAGSCEATVEEGKVLSDPPGNCKQLVCDASGNAVEAADPADLPEDTDCTTGSCSGMEPQQLPKSNGTLCGEGDLACEDGKCSGCVDPSQCPAPTTPACQAATCTDATCAIESINESSNCKPPATACHLASRCKSGSCDERYRPPGFEPTDTVKDCKKPVCDGNGNTNIVNDDSDAPDDTNLNDCVVPSCSNGSVVMVNKAPGSPCGGAPTQCFNQSTCSGSTCTQNPKPAGTLAGNDPTPGDCKRPKCDGAGNVNQNAPHDADVPTVSAGDCKGWECKNGSAEATNAPNNSSCESDAAKKCCQGACCTNGSHCCKPDTLTCGGGGC